MAKLRNRPGNRTRLLLSRLFRAASIFPLMDWLNRTIRHGRRSCRLAVQQRTRPIHSAMTIFRRRTYSKFRCAWTILIIRSLLPGQGPTLIVSRLDRSGRHLVQDLKVSIVIMIPQAAGPGPNVLRKERTQCKVSNEGLTANLALHTLRGLCNAAASPFITSHACPNTQLPTAACA